MAIELHSSKARGAFELVEHLADHGGAPAPPPRAAALGGGLVLSSETMIEIQTLKLPECGTCAQPQTRFNL